MYCPGKPLGTTLDQCLAKSLPMLPGNTFNFNVGADRFHLSHHWGFLGKNLPVLLDKENGTPKPGIGGRSLPPWAPCKTMPETSVYPQGCGPKVPSWVAFDKQVLTFHGYFQEPIPESRLENYRVHQCKILFFLEDDTIKVVEPETYNAGLPQGTIVRRHRIPLPSPCENNYYTIEHLNVGCEINLYGKVFFICSCDKFTRNFLNRLGIPVGPDVEMPKDIATEKMIDAKISMFPRKPYHGVDTRGPFLEHDRHVLRFWAYWDDRCNLNGDLRKFVVHYFLSDGTMEVREEIRPNSGYDAFPAFIRRGKIPKNTNDLVPLPGVITPQTVLNVFGSAHATSGPKRGHYLLDNLGIGALNVEYYKDNDLAIGAVINVFGRAFTLCDCDEFTKQYYREKYDVKDFTPLVLDEPKKEWPCPQVPPYHGWGTEEDSLVSWKSLEMKPHVKDCRKEALMEKDILRFQAKFFKPQHKVNDDRRFTISYFMADDTIQIFENEHPNTGLPKGAFLIRCRIKKPGYDPLKGVEAEYYEPAEFFVGAIMELNGFTFQLISGDEFTYKYMELNHEKFPHADVAKCLRKVREAFGPLVAEDVLLRFSQCDCQKQGVASLDDFRCILMELTKYSLSEHEVITLCRAYECAAPPPGTDWSTVQAICQTELRKNNFDKHLLVRIEYTCRYHDPCRTGKINRDIMKATLKGAKLPLFKELLEYLVKNWPSDPDDKECCKVDYCCMLRFLNWEDNPAPVAKPAAIQCVLKWVEPQPPPKIFCVNYRAFLEDVCPNFKCALPAVCCCCDQGGPCPLHPGGPPCSSGQDLTTPMVYKLDSDSSKMTPLTITAQTFDPDACAKACRPIELHVSPCAQQITCVPPHKCHPDAPECHEHQRQGYGSNQCQFQDTSSNQGQGFSSNQYPQNGNNYQSCEANQYQTGQSNEYQQADATQYQQFQQNQLQQGPENPYQQLQANQYERGQGDSYQQCLANQQ